jgi:hypothetical protein
MIIMVAVSIALRPSLSPKCKPYRVRAEGRQRAGERIERREEQLVEDERRGRPVDQEVVPFDDGAKDARPDDTAQSGLLRGGIGGQFINYLRDRHCSLTSLLVE